MSNFRGTDLCKSLKSHKRSDSKEIWQQRDLTAKRSHSKGIPQKRDLTAKRSHSKESRRKEIWQQRDLTAKTSVLEGSLPRKLCFHIFTFHFLREVSHKALFSQLQLSLFEGCLARKLRFHIFNFQIWGKSRTKASFSHLHFQIWREVSHESLQFSLFVGSLTRKLRFYMFNLHLHVSFVFTRFVGAAAACVILWSFAAGHRGSYWSGCIQVARVICQRTFPFWRCNFPFKIPFEGPSKSSFLFCFSANSGATVRESLCV